MLGKRMHFCWTVVYDAMTRLENVCTRTSFEQLDTNSMSEFRQEILRAVMKYLAQANRIRKEYFGNREVD